MRDKNGLAGIVALLVITVGIVKYANNEDEPENLAEAMTKVAHQPRLPAEELIEWISEGEEVEIVDYLEHGKLTVVEFTADW